MARPLERPATRRGSALQILHHSDLPRKGQRYLVGDRLLESGNVPVDTVKAAEIPFLQEDAFFGQCRSEEHTSELQSLMRISYAVFCLKKKKQHQKTHYDCNIISTMSSVSDNINLLTTHDDTH